MKTIDASLQSSDNQTVVRIQGAKPDEDFALRGGGLRCVPTYCSYMSPYTALSSSRLNQDSSGETKYRLTDSTEAMLDELAHDLRQPLSTIENLACLLQMNVTDGKAAAYIEQIQDLIEQANRILDKAQAGLFCASV